MQKSKYILAIIAMIVVSCSSAPKQAKCVKESEKDLLINWGTQYNKTGWRVYHSINSKMEIVKVEEDSLGNKKFSDSSRISEENYCRIKQDLVNFVVKTQALAFPGIVQQFVEYNSPGQNVYFRAIWNPEHTNAGNKELRVFFDSLDYRAK